MTLVPEIRENNLSIHIEAGNLYFNGLNTGESFYEFVMSQKDTSKKKKIVNAKLHYSGSFEHYLTDILQQLTPEQMLDMTL